MNRRRVLTTAVASFAVSGLSGCTAGQTWATVEAERRRILVEAKRLVSAELHDQLTTIVFDRARVKPESIVTGYQHAITRVNRERLALAASSEKFRQICLLSERTGHKWKDYDKEDWQDSLTVWAAEVRNAQQMLVLAEAAQQSDDWLPVFDVLLGERFPHSRSALKPRELPDSDQLRLRRARELFADWTKRFHGTVP